MLTVEMSFHRFIKFPFFNFDNVVNDEQDKDLQPKLAVNFNMHKILTSKGNDIIILLQCIQGQL